MNETLLSVGIHMGTLPPGGMPSPQGAPFLTAILGGSEFRLREIFVSLRFHGLTPAPLGGAPVVEVPA